MHAGRDSSRLPSVSDGHTKVLPISSWKVRLDSPILIAGFPDAGMIGSVTINHIIEQLQMHQIAYIESQYVMPAAIFIGKRFRHAFRIYADDSGTYCAIVCEVPISVKGVYSIVNTIVEWSERAGVGEILVLGGMLPTNFSPSYMPERKVVLLRNDSSAEAASKRDSKLTETQELATPDNALIVGLAGALLSVSATRGIRCKALMIPAMSDSPDPEGAALVLEALPKILPRLKIDTSLLRQKVEMIKKQLEDFLKMHHQNMQEYDRPASRESERIYK